MSGNEVDGGNEDVVGDYCGDFNSDWMCPLPDGFAEFDFGWLNES